MGDPINERFERIDANLAQSAESLRRASEQIQFLTTFGVQWLERQSVLKHQHEEINAKLDRILAATAVDTENIRALVRIAESRQRRNEVPEDRDREGQ
jgi:hypothetical protein